LHCNTLLFDQYSCPTLGLVSTVTAAVMMIVMPLCGNTL